MDEFHEDEDDWVKMAEADPSHVADLLLRLRDAPLPPPPPPSPPSLCPFPKLRLTVQRPRSNSTRRRSAASIPFLWSAIAIEGRREDPKPVDDDDDSSRSPKVGDQSETTVFGNNSSNRKRTFDELKGKTSSLLKRGSDLKKELVFLHFSNKKPRAKPTPTPTPTPESLKLKLKINLATGKVLQVCSTSAESGKTVTDPPQLADAPCIPSESVSLRTAKDKVSGKESTVCAANASSKQQEISECFFLPDLNLPLSEDLD